MNRNQSEIIIKLLRKLYNFDDLLFHNYLNLILLQIIDQRGLFTPKLYSRGP